jgi:hypothetical protein
VANGGVRDRGWAGLGLYKISTTLGLEAKLKRRSCDANDRRDVWRGRCTLYVYRTKKHYKTNHTVQRLNFKTDSALQYIPVRIKVTDQKPWKSVSSNESVWINCQPALSSQLPFDTPPSS